MILLSNIFAIFLQSLCIKLGTVTGMNLAENCRAHLPRWLNYILYAFAEAAIIATDIAEVSAYLSTYIRPRYLHRVGHWYCDRFERATEGPARGWVRDLNRGCAHHSSLLQSNRHVYARLTHLRVVCGLACSRSRGLLLFPAQSRPRRGCPRSIPRVLALIRIGSIKRVSFWSFTIT